MAVLHSRPLLSPLVILSRAPASFPFYSNKSTLCELHLTVNSRKLIPLHVDSVSLNSSRKARAGRMAAIQTILERLLVPDNAVIQQVSV